MTAEEIIVETMGESIAAYPTGATKTKKGKKALLGGTILLVIIIIVVKLVTQ